MIKLNCPKCGKDYELDNKLDGKSWRCSCGEVFNINSEIIELDSNKILYTPWKYLSESFEFIKNNILSLLWAGLLIGIPINILSKYILNIGWWYIIATVFLSWILWVYIGIITINYTYNKLKNQDYTIKQAFSASVNKILWSILIFMLIWLMFYVLILPLIIWFSLIVIATYYTAASSASAWTIALVWLVLFVIWLIWLWFAIYFLVKYSFAYINFVLNWVRWLQALKLSSKQSIWIKWKLFLIQISIYWSAIICMLIIMYLLGNLANAQILYIHILIWIFWTILDIIFFVIITKLFMNVTWRN